jgi:AraC family transcriptional regulator, arabinose operon regulatory protein
LHYPRIMPTWPNAGEIELRNVRVYENSPDWSWNSLHRPHFNLWIALEGEAHFVRGGVEYPVSAGSAFLLDPSEAVTCRTTRRAGLVNFAAHFMAPRGFAERAHVTHSPGAPTRIRSGGWLLQFCRHLSELFYLDREGHALELLQGIGYLLLTLKVGRAERELDAVERRLLQIVEGIRQNPALSRRTDELARQANLSSSQFARRFRAFTGLSPARFIIEERLARAEAYLQESNFTLAEIAERTGYSDVYFFSRQFRRFRGVPPSVQRERGRR